MLTHVVYQTILGLVLFQLGGCQAQADEHILFLDDGEIRLGIDAERGAAISWISSKSHPKNMVNIADPGRFVQQSHYAGLSIDRRDEGQHAAWCPWSWNPIQGGGVGRGGSKGVWAEVTEFRLLNGLLASETIPRLWDMKDEAADAVMKQTMALEGGLTGVVVVQCELKCRRSEGDRCGPAVSRAQELPACYFIRQLSDTQSYLGHGEWKREEQAAGPPWGKAAPPLKAMATFNSRGQGVGVFSPVAGEQWNFGPHGTGDSSDSLAGPCVHMAPLARIKLGPASTLKYRYWLVVGDQASIAQRFDELLARYPDETFQLTGRGASPLRKFTFSSLSMSAGISKWKTLF